MRTDKRPKGLKSGFLRARMGVYGVEGVTGAQTCVLVACVFIRVLNMLAIACKRRASGSRYCRRPRSGTGRRIS